MVTMKRKLHRIRTGLLAVAIGVCALAATPARADESACSAAAVQERVEQTMLRFAGHAPELSLPVLRFGLSAFYRARCLGETRRDVLSIIDFTLPSSAQRLWVLDVARAAVLFHVRAAHGRGSGDAQAERFSDRMDSHATSLGLFITGSTYSGKHGYSLQIDGLEPGVNGHARQRGVVIHPADYMTERFVEQHGRAGRSYGCPALDPAVSKPVIDAIKGGSVLWAYYPDPAWLDSSRYLPGAGVSSRASARP
jgi:hypothetical protein